MPLLPLPLSYDYAGQDPINGYDLNGTCWAELCSDMNRWLFNWDEAAARPRRTMLFISLSGLVGGGVIGYFRFGHSIGYAVALGLGVALVLGAVAWQNVRDPTRTARPVRIGAVTLRIAVPFIALAVAVAIGVALNSFMAFLIALAAGLAIGFALSRFARH